ncbi:MAG: hypothetical protein R2708_26210 [Vicinamibacterales bacterium]
MPHRSTWLRPALAAVFVTAALGAATPLAAQTPGAATDAGRGAHLPDGEARRRSAELQKVMPAEVRHTLGSTDGAILWWFGRGDGRGVVFVLKGVTTDDARAITDTLPLSKAGLVTFEYVPLTTLTPLRQLLGAAGAAKP